MREVYSKSDILEAMEETMRDGMFKSTFLRELVKTKLNRLEKKHRELHAHYEEHYEHHVERFKEVENYSLGQPLMKKINKCINDLNKLMKQIEFMRSLKEDEYANVDRRTERVLKDMKKYLR